MDNAPDPKDVQEFQFKQASVCQIFDGCTYVPALCSLLAVDKKRGLVYIGHDNKITVLKPGHATDAEWKFQVDLPVVMSKIALSCDNTYLAVTPIKPAVLIYDVQALTKSSLVLLHEIRISSSTTDAFVYDIKWNPSVPGMLCTVASDHTVGSFQIKDGKERMVGITALERLNGLDVMCAAWSPKGKQIVVGCKNGNIVQLKPDLKVARTIPGPQPYIGGVSTILWISNYQFCAVYLGNDQRLNVLIVDAPKGEANGVFTCYEDITYGMPDSEGEGSMQRYYFEHIPEWGLIIAASSGSSEIAVLGSTNGGATWNQWQLIDSGRAQLPLIRTTESYPLGIAIDRSPVQKLPWGADSTLPIPVPLLHILGTSGQLCSFHMVNLTPNCPSVNSPPTEVVTAPQQPRPSIAPSELSFSLNNAATSTPRPKQPEVIERPKTSPIVNMFGDSLKAAGLFHQPEKTVQEEPPRPQEEKVQPVPVKTEVLAPIKEVSQPNNVKVDVKPMPIKEAPPPEVREQKTVIDDSICIRAYLEEQSIFEKELRDRLEPNTWECGTEDERKQLGERAAVIDQFLRDLRDTTNGLSSDISYLKALLLQSFAWVEETKSKNEASTDIALKYGADNSKIAELQRLYYYTHSQLIQATKSLDLEWSDHKSQNDSKMKIPNLEMIYQNLVMHNKIILKQKSEVEYLTRRWKLFTRTHSLAGLNSSLSNLQIGSSKSSVNVRGNETVIEARCKAIASKTLNFTREKQMKLKNLLSENSPRTIKPVNPSPIQDRLEATLSTLALQRSSTVEAKNKTQQPTATQVVPIKQTTEKQKAQSPLASLNSIVARIGSSDMSMTAAQNKSQPKSVPASVPFPCAPVNKIGQTDKKPIAPTNSTKPFPKVDSISFGAPTPKPQELMAQKLAPKEDIAVTNDKEPSMSAPNDMSKTMTPLFSTDSLNNVLSKFPLPKGDQVQGAQTAVSFKQPTTAEQVSTLPSPSQQAFSFASKQFSFAAKPAPMPAGQAPAENSFDLGGLSLDAQSASNSFVNSTTAEIKPVTGTETTGWTSNLYKLPSSLQVFSMPSVTQNMPQTSGPPPAVTTAAISLKVLTSPISSAPAQEANANDSAVSTFPGSIQQSLSSPQSISIFGNQPSTASMSIFGGTSAVTITVTTAAAPVSSTFPVSSGVPLAASTPPAFGTQAASTTSAFGGFSNSSTTMPTVSTLTAVSSSSPFYSSPTKPATSPPMKIAFGMPTTVNSIAPAFGKASTSPLAAGTQFPNTPTSSAANIFGTQMNAGTSPFGGTSNRLFGTAATTLPSSTIFGGSSKDTIFGNNAPATTSTSIFGGNAMSKFSMPSSGSIFGAAPSKPGLVFGGSSTTGTTSLFGDTATRTSPAVANGSVGGNTSVFGSPASSSGPVPGSPAGSASVFGGAATSTSPIAAAGSPTAMSSQSAFGQTSTFGAKPVFGSPPSIFDTSKQVFGSEFGSSPFGGKSTPAAGFGSPPAMGGSPPPMGNTLSKMFGNPTGSTTFESLASQAGGLTFGSLAQKSPEPEKPPTFSGGSSFSSWR